MLATKQNQRAALRALTHLCEITVGSSAVHCTIDVDEGVSQWKSPQINKYMEESFGCLSCVDDEFWLVEAADLNMIFILGRNIVSNKLKVFYCLHRGSG